MTIKLAKNIELQAITIKDQPKLQALMTRIYPPAYKHLWRDEDCNFYINNFYSQEQLAKELAESKATYHFVMFNSECVGIVRVQFNKPYLEFAEKQATFINKIYLGDTAQGRGVAATILEWIRDCAKNQGSDLIWLKAMDSQAQALGFYKKHGFRISGTTRLDFELLHKPLRGMYIMHQEL